MTDQRAPADPYTTRFEAAVERIDGRNVVLDSTYFYAESGGQPADRGTLGGVDVTDVRVDAGEVIHTLADEPPFGAGETVSGAVDDEFRTYCMRAHTASHALYGAARGLLDDLGYGGFGITPEKIRIDFETTTDVDGAVLATLERRVNGAVWDSREVTWEQVPREEALSRADIAFNTKTEEGVLADSDTVRVVEIEGFDDAEVSSAGPEPRAWDAAACGGTHVSNTREIGPVSLLSRSNPGEGLTRIEFAVGPGAIDRRAEDRRILADAAGALGTSRSGIPDEIERLRDDLAAAEDELATLKADLVDARIAELREETVEREGRTWLAGTVDGLGPNALGERAKELAGDAADVVALAGRDGAAFLVVGAADGVDAGAVVSDVTDRFGGGGGGSATFAQGGGMDADPDDIVADLR